MSNLEVKVGQVWVGGITGERYTIVSVSDDSVTIKWGDEFTSKIKKNNLYLGFNLVEDVDDLHSNTSLRDHFAGLAMSKIISTSSDYEFISTKAYKIADAMLKARSE